MYKFIIALVFLCIPHLVLGAERLNNIEVKCDNGVIKKYNPFNNTMSPERLCGEIEVVVPDNPVMVGFEDVYGEPPTQESTGLEGRELSRAQFLYNRDKANFGGLVTMWDVMDPANSVNPDALMEALAVDNLKPEDFNELKMEELRQGYTYYGIGEFKFFLTRMQYFEDNKPVQKYRLRTYYPEIPGYFNSGVNTVKAPTIPVAQAQVELGDKRGICPKNIISLLDGIQLEACQ